MLGDYVTSQSVHARCLRHLARQNTHAMMWGVYVAYVLCEARRAEHYEHMCVAHMRTGSPCIFGPIPVHSRWWWWSRLSGERGRRPSEPTALPAQSVRYPASEEPVGLRASYVAAQARTGITQEPYGPRRNSHALPALRAAGGISLREKIPPTASSSMKKYPLSALRAAQPAFFRRKNTPYGRILSIFQSLPIIKFRPEMPLLWQIQA